MSYLILIGWSEMYNGGEFSICVEFGFLDCIDLSFCRGLEE